VFRLETPLKARLATIEGIKGVHGYAELPSAQGAGKPAPALYALWNGYRVIESQRDGSSARIAVRWLIVLHVVTARDTATGDAARQLASPLTNAVLTSLLGWKAPDHQPLKLIPAPLPDFEAGSLWVPLAFEAETVVRGMKHGINQ
jgi:hypothetical protein